MSNRLSLYITYDGLTDTLGQSQILPYLIGLQKYGVSNFHIISFEKHSRYIQFSNLVYSQLSDVSISWSPFTFTRSFGFFGKLYDLVLMVTASFLFVLTHKVDVIHARSHIPAHVAALLKIFTRVPYIFDFRGLWVDEKIDKGAFNLSNLFHLLQYRFLKFTEYYLIHLSDHVIVLTHSLKNFFLVNSLKQASCITIIPCCADFSHFKLATSHSRFYARSLLNIPDTCFCIGYLGSVGTMYMPEYFMQFASNLLKTDTNIHFLILTPDSEMFSRLIEAYIDENFHSFFTVRSASRQEVADFLPSISLLVSFILPTHARIGASPTKLAEAWACGIPTLSNSGVGDLEYYASTYKLGSIIDLGEHSIPAFTVDSLQKLPAYSGSKLRVVASKFFDLPIALDAYSKIYCHLMSSI